MNVITDGQEYYDQVFEQIHLDPAQRLTAQFTDCKFVNCDFDSAVLSSCRFSGCVFQDCNLSMVGIPGSAFPAVRFQRSKLIGVDWTQGDWSQSVFNQLVGFFDCVISHSTFIGMNLKGIQMRNCVAHEADFREADLSGVNFRGTDLVNSLFGGTNLTGADLSAAKNYHIDPGNNILKGSKFSLPEAMALLYSMDIELIEQDDMGW